jgi:hypothetical protein
VRGPLVFKLSHFVECNVAIPMRGSNGYSAALVGASMTPSRVVTTSSSGASDVPVMVKPPVVV